MSVHEAITKHVTAQNRHLTEFLELDELRERAIEEAVALCKRGLPFSVDAINHYTKLINEHAGKGISPQRRSVTVDMLREYALRSNS